MRKVELKITLFREVKDGPTSGSDGLDRRFVVRGRFAGARKKGPVYATFKTSMGDIVIQLFEDKAPKTVANFVELATGTKEWTDPKTKEKVKRPLYNGTIFHRVIPGFMIQGGDPLGNGTGGRDIDSKTNSTPT